MGSLPEEGLSQEIGRLAKRALGTKLPKSWIDKELDGDTDFGIDYLMQLKSKQNQVSFSFYFQLKGTTSPSYSADKSFISYEFKGKTLRFYYQQEPLVMVGVVDLKNNTDELWKCPIYYVWLDEEWFDSNKSKLDSNETITIRVPTNQVIVNSLDVYDLYRKRFDDKLALNELHKAVKIHSDDAQKSIRLIGEKVSESPILLKTIEERNDAPWIKNPEGVNSTFLKACSDYLLANKVVLASKQIDELKGKENELSEHEKAELHFQEANLLAMKGLYDDSFQHYELACKYSSKKRYQLGFIEAKFKLEELPSKLELQGIVDKLDEESYHSCIVKAKCLTFLDKAEEAVALLEEHYPDKKVGMMLILTISGKVTELDNVIESNKETNWSNEREKYLFNALSARRSFSKATNKSHEQNEVLPIQGKCEYDLVQMKAALNFVSKTWESAKNLGYPSDLVTILDISPLIFGYFGQLQLLYGYFEEILSERPSHQEVIRCYSRLLFNEGEYQHSIDIVENLADKANVDDCEILILSNYNLKRLKNVLELVKKHENKLLENKDLHSPLVFCIASEVAKELFEKELADKYEAIVLSFENGEELLAVRDFISSSNNDPKNRQKYALELYNKFEKLNNSLVIAEQLFRYLDAFNQESAQKIIELGKCLLVDRELTPSDCLHLAQAFFTTGDWNAAEEIADKNIEKGIDIQNWELIKAAASQNKGHIGVALRIIENVINSKEITQEQQRFYVNLCLKLGLFNDAESVLLEMYGEAGDRINKLSVLQTLISVYSAQEGFEEKLKQAVDRYGTIVDQNDCSEEGSFLLFFLTSPSHQNEPEKIKEFQSRLAKYTENFPDSPVLRKTTFNPNDSVENILSSMQELAGITNEQVALWDKNRNLIRNGSLPVPFCLLEHFLADTRDVYTSWVLSLNTPEDNLEFKIKHAPQLEQSTFESLLSEQKEVLLEETSMLVLHELGILDKFLSSIPSFSLLDSVFSKISRMSHPLGGSVYSGIPSNLLKVINNHIDKLQVKLASGENILFEYIGSINRNDVLLLSDDLYLFQYLCSENKNIVTSNSVNVIEYLRHKKLISEDEKHELVAKLCKLGIYEPNMHMEVLTSSFCYYLNVVGGVDYSDTKFRLIFDKLFDSSRETGFTVELFFRMLLQASNQMKFTSQTLLSLFRGLLVRHQYKDMQSLITFWFVWISVFTPPYIENELILVSAKNADYWNLYKEMMSEIANREMNAKELTGTVVRHVLSFKKNISLQAYQNIKTCFVPLTEEAEAFEANFTDLSIQRKLERKGGLFNL
jgi:uncharacterized protein DUF4365